MWAVRLPFLFILLFLILFVVFARLQYGPPDCSVQHRTSPGNSRSQCAAPDLTGEFPNGACNTGPLRGTPERSVLCRTSPGELPNGVCNTGPLRGTPERSVLCRTSPGELPNGVCSAGPHSGSSKKDCQKYVRQECQKIWQKICHKMCQ